MENIVKIQASMNRTMFQGSSFKGLAACPVYQKWQNVPPDLLLQVDYCSITGNSCPVKTNGRM